MNKSIIITGSSAFKNVKKAIELALEFKSEEVIWISAHTQKEFESNFLYSDCNKSTKLVVIQHINKQSDLHNFYNAVVSGVTVNKQGLAPYEIHPKFIIIFNNSNFSQVPSDYSFQARFDVFDTIGNVLIKYEYPEIITQNS